MYLYAGNPPRPAPSQPLPKTGPNAPAAFGGRLRIFSDFFNQIP